MCTSKSKSNNYANSEPVSDAEPKQLPKPITDKLAELYAEYIQPEHFIEWLFEQEQIKRNLTKQQQQLELQHQHHINIPNAHVNRWNCNQFIKRNGGFIDSDEQLNGKHDDPK